MAYMFTYLHPDSSAKQTVSFLASLLLQLAVLAVLCLDPSSRLAHPSIRSNVALSSPVTPIYFQNEKVAIPSATEVAPTAAASAALSSVPQRAPEPPNEAKPDTAQQAHAEAGTTDDGSGKGEGQGLAPFPSWRMNSMASGFAGMHHQIKNALPVFTPDPPVLHGAVPEFARGKDVIFEVVIDAQGSIIQTEVIQGVGYELESSIMETLRRWIYVPAKFNGVAIASRLRLRFHFPG